MKIGVIGNGRMGQAVIEEIAASLHELLIVCDSVTVPIENQRALKVCDVLIDFSLPHLALDNIRLYTSLGVPAVIGVTGWYDDLKRVQNWVEESQSSILFAANFSTGVALFKKMLHSIARLDLSSFDLSIHEIHHMGKLDSPSGTAIQLAECLDEAIPFNSERVGDIKGIHTLEFQGESENLEIRHSVKDRSVFAQGALRAAEWLLGRQGLFTFDDVFQGSSRGTSLPITINK